MGNKLNNYSILKKPEAILFDTDNTLYNYYPANKAAEEAVCKKAKNLLGLEKKEFLFVYKKAKSEVKMNLDKNASSHSRLLYFQRMIELLGYKSQLLLSLDFEQTFWRTFLANAPLFPGVKETLLFFKQIEIPNRKIKACKYITSSCMKMKLILKIYLRKILIITNMNIK